MINWEGNYTLDGVDVLLQVKCEGPDPDTGIPGMQIISAHAFDVDGKELPISESQFDAIAADAAIYERIEDQLAADAEAWAERDIR
jgi:hypothetical protein